MNTNIYTNVPFTVTESISNANGFLLPHNLYNKIKTVASYPIKEFYLQDAPDLSDVKFKMHKNAFIDDELTIQAQLIKKHDNGYLVNVIVTKPKPITNHHETICSALFGVTLDKNYFKETKTAC
ncbi:conserved hypothetical protein [Formosa agariphila KMM 3901]|uniref:Uncharacterized protein n=1 Tax=Formosa agariphila (strain DSM 15362 / KCTC 12365 / LMG 23005 / KMM 3901 / M-2Alg 35-1) TaxID=1347342 RepID=T2KN54_FORAG|nr:hypothetical protein [Formosa agariphila]CDF80190.1 conserved hypothetical protein [Formosa agariphila KMM 3901]